MSRAFACIFFLFAGTLGAATSTTWEVSGFSEFLKGRLSGLTLTADGIMRLGPAPRWSANLDQPAGWAAAADSAGNLYVATGHQGKVFRLTADGKPSLIWTAPESEVFALCIDKKGIVYAATSPNGGVYRLEAGRAKEIWHSPARYIWAIQQGTDGSIFAATGGPGKVFRISADGQASEYYDTGQENVTALTAGANSHLYAGTDPNGIVYDITGSGRGTVLYDSSLPEIRAIVLAPNGDLYVAAMGGAVTSRSASAASTATTAGAVVPTTPTVITVTAARTNGIRSDSPDNDQAQIKPSEQGKTVASSTSASAAATSNTAVVEVSGVERSAIYRITPDRVIQTLRSSNSDNVYDLILDGDSVVFGTDDHGRIYRLNGRRPTLLAEPGDGETTRLLKSGAEITAILSNPARVIRFGTAGTSAGSYESQVHDANSVAHWGHMQWHGAGTGVVFKTRTGNGARPDATWSAWSSPITESGTMLIDSPPARYVQWRAEWPAGSNAEIDDVSVPFLPQNSPPAIHSITVSSVVGTNAAKANAGLSTGSSSGAYSITVTDTGEAPAASTSTTTAQNVSRLQTTQTQISWQADDPDGDKLVFSVYFRPEDASQWQLIRSRMFENTLLLDPDVFADGRYFFRVVASDSPSNAAPFAQTAEMVSSPVVIDNTPPAVTIGQPRRSGDAVEIEVEATDKSSPLRLCEYSLDAGMWQPVEAEDGITDSPHERFQLHLEKIRPGEHLLVLRVYDTANNAGLARIVLR